MKKLPRKVYLSLFVGLMILLVAMFIRGCSKPMEEPAEIYVLPDAHSDNSSDLKTQFFDEPFSDIQNAPQQISSLNGTPLLIVMFPSFLTVDGRHSLLGLESLRSEFGDRFTIVVIPVEDAETVKPALKDVPEGMLFLFRDGGKNNLSLSDKYSDLFWNPKLIAADFPLDPEGRHNTSPFYWVVDSKLVIREKLIDYSDATGVSIGEIKEVMEALMKVDEPENPTTVPDESESTGVQPEGL